MDGQNDEVPWTLASVGTADVVIDVSTSGPRRKSRRFAYCRTAEKLSIAAFELEHIIPRSRGGEAEFDNLCLACPTCNRHEADRTSARDPDIGQEVPLFHPHHSSWSDHFAWTADGTEIIGLTPTGRATIAAFRINRPQLVRLRRIWVAQGEHPPMAE